MTNFNSAGMSRRGPPPNRGGRGGGQGNILGQGYGKTLIARNISQHIDPVYQEFLEFKRQKEGNTSYAQALGDEESSSNLSYLPNEEKQVILVLEDVDKQWINNPDKILDRYLQDRSYTAGAYKCRKYYESLLENCESCIFQHFHPNHNSEINSFSKFTVKRIISIEEWGISPFKEKIFYYKDNKTPVHYNFWDYVEAFYKVLFYQNPNKKHTWWIKICTKVFDQKIPNWFLDWWKFFGTQPGILPENLSVYFTEWKNISPLIKTINEKFYFVYFMIEFSIPYIWKWTPEVEMENEVSYLKRASHTKIWDKLMKIDPKTNQVWAIETIEQIQSTLAKYRKMAQEEEQAQIRINKGKDLLGLDKLSKEQVIDLYLEKLKEELGARDTDQISQKSDKSMISSSSNNFQALEYLEDSQRPESPIPLEDLMEEIRESLHENLRERKNKGPVIQEKDKDLIDISKW